MADREKKIAAALAAVNAYLQQEASEAEARHGEPILAGGNSLRADAWSQSGRQEMMAMRRLIQMRTFTCFR